MAIAFSEDPADCLAGSFACYMQRTVRHSAAGGVKGPSRFQRVATATAATPDIAAPTMNTIRAPETNASADALLASSEIPARSPMTPRESITAVMIAVVAAMAATWVEFLITFRNAAAEL